MLIGQGNVKPVELLLHEHANYSLHVALTLIQQVRQLRVRLLKTHAL